ncbi:MAG: HAMP domain-containing histidine kinase [Polyangiaceae bacterium]|nr:HAMP domain-containing histidine kinase [Polyangiaceae bacterium]
MTDARVRDRRRRTIAGRVLLSYVVLTAAFVVVTGYGAVALERAAVEAELLRSGHLPLALALRDAVGEQDAWNEKIAHLAQSRDPYRERAWLTSTLDGSRPRSFAKVRAAIHRALVAGASGAPSEVGRELMGEAGEIERSLDPDRDGLRRLFDALEREDSTLAEVEQSTIEERGRRAKERLAALELRIQGSMDDLVAEARARERLALRLLLGLALAGVGVGVGIALWARHVLAPLRALTARAQAVARGDLTARPELGTGDELGELSRTFESMVAAIDAAKAQLVSQERLAAIGKMAAHVTHEIRNPLSALALNVQLLEEDLPAGATEARSLLLAIDAEIQRLRVLSDQYLTVARQQPLQLERWSLAEAVDDAVAFLRLDLERRGIRVVVEHGGGEDAARIDEPRLRQALFNLMRNAADAMPDGGTLRIRTDAPPARPLEVSLEDEGPGIDEQVRERLFEPFFTTKGHGTGLGLAITRQIVEAHGGAIECEPRAPHGTRFIVRLPRPAPGAPIEAA